MFGDGLFGGARFGEWAPYVLQWIGIDAGGGVGSWTLNPATSSSIGSIISQDDVGQGKTTYVVYGVGPESTSSVGVGNLVYYIYLAGMPSQSDVGIWTSTILPTNINLISIVSVSDVGIGIIARLFKKIIGHIVKSSNGFQAGQIDRVGNAGSISHVTDYTASTIKRVDDVGTLNKVPDLVGVIN